MVFGKLNFKSIFATYIEILSSSSDSMNLVNIPPVKGPEGVQHAQWDPFSSTKIDGMLITDKCNILM